MNFLEFKKGKVHCHDLSLTPFINSRVMIVVISSKYGTLLCNVFLNAPF